MREICARRAEVEVLCREYRVRRLDLFGSAAAGTFQPGKSDLDFLVEFDPAPPGGYASAYFGLLEGLEGLFKCRVDLVAATAVRSPYFRQSMEQTRTLLYSA